MDIYLISSESRMIIKEETEKIIGNETNIIICDYLKEGIDFILEEASYLSLFDEKKYLIIKNSLLFGSEKTKEEDVKKLEKYLDNPNPNTIIIFQLNEKLDYRKKITKKLKEQYKIIAIENLDYNELSKKIKNIVKKNNLEIAEISIKHIIASGLNNYDLIINELEKIILYSSDKKKIELDDVINLISKNIEENIFRFSDAVVNKDHAKAFQLFKDLKLIKEEPIILINNLAREFRLMIKAGILMKKGYNKNQIAKELGLRDWLVEKIIRNSYNYNENELYDKLIALSDLDVNIKQGKIDKYLGIELFILDI